MKKIISITLVLLMLIPMAVFAGTPFMTGIKVYNNMTTGTNFTIINGATPVWQPELTDGNISTCYSVTTNAIWSDFGVKKTIDGYSLRSLSNDYSGILYFYDNNNNLVSTITAQAKYTTSQIIPISQPISAYKWKFVNNTGTARNVCELQFTETPDIYPPSAPNLTTAQGNNMSVNLTWTKPTQFDLAGYKIYKNGTLLTTINNVNTLTYTESNVSPLISNGYQVTAFDDLGNQSSLSNILYATSTDTTPPSKPTITNVEADDNSVSIFWNASTDNHQVAGYKIFVNNVYEKTVTTTNTTIGGLFNKTTYTFTVKAVDPSGNESLSDSQNGTPIDIYPPYQSPPTLGEVTETSIEIQWPDSTSADAVKYEVSRNNFSTFQTINDNNISSYSHTFTGLSSGQSYVVSVRAVDDDNIKSSPESLSVTTLAIPPPIPTNITMTPLDNEIMINWDDSTADDIANYKVYEFGTNALLATVTSSQFNQTGLENTVEKCYQISAVDIHGNESQKSQKNCAAPIDIIPPFDVSNIQTVGSTEYNYTFSWEKIPGQDTKYFKIYKNGTLASTVNYVAGQDQYEYTATSLTPGIVYNYQVNPVDDDGNELLTGTQGLIELSTIGIPPAAPTGFTALAEISKLKFSWTENLESDVTSYKLYKVVNGNYNLITTTPNLNYDYNLTDTTTMNYVLTAVDQGGSESSYSESISIAPLPNVTTLPFENAEIGVNASDVVQSGLGLSGLMKWFLIAALVFIIALSVIEKYQKDKKKENKTKGNKLETSSDEQKVKEEKEPRIYKPRKKRRKYRGLFGMIHKYYDDKQYKSDLEKYETQKSERKEKQQKERERIREEKKRIIQMKADVRKKMSNSLGYKVYKKD